MATGLEPFAFNGRVIKVGWVVCCWVLGNAAGMSESSVGQGSWQLWMGILPNAGVTP